MQIKSLSWCFYFVYLPTLRPPIQVGFLRAIFLTTSGIVGKHACHLSVDTEDSKNITSLATCPAACSALVDGCKGTVHARCCRCLATSAAFTAKVAAWPTTQSKRKWAPADHLPEGEQSEYTETFFTCNLTLTKNNGQRDVQRHEGK